MPLPAYAGIFTRRWSMSSCYLGAKLGTLDQSCLQGWRGFISGVHIGCHGSTSQGRALGVFECTCLQPTFCQSVALKI